MRSMDRDMSRVPAAMRTQVEAMYQQQQQKQKQKQQQRLTGEDGPFSDASSPSLQRYRYGAGDGGDDGYLDGEGLGAEGGEGSLGRESGTGTGAGRAYYYPFAMQVLGLLCTHCSSVKYLCVCVCLYALHDL